MGAVEVPGHLAGMVELELGKAGKPALGFAVHVPHYLVNGEHPRAALAMLDEVAKATGLSIPLGGLQAAADAADKSLDAQVAKNPENVEAIRMLESQYDTLVARPDGGAGAHRPRRTAAVRRRDRGAARGLPARARRPQARRLSVPGWAGRGTARADAVRHAVGWFQSYRDQGPGMTVAPAAVGHDARVR